MSNTNNSGQYGPYKYSNTQGQGNNHNNDQGQQDAISTAKSSYSASSWGGPQYSAAPNPVLTGDKKNTKKRQDEAVKAAGERKKTEIERTQDEKTKNEKTQDKKTQSKKTREKKKSQNKEKNKIKN
ncbi:hypothetical protein CC78DRAFT_578598 [Lojkania enalia]|uniref:Uncharacterized protein n=1 Tax=Lojkania enalia TaxID=147567 RepID=A0A9P4KC81_9PLEO|nr:hypothetical protein CC78DRAFT_578598 [Didymosphaeria enalia]